VPDLTNIEDFAGISPVEFARPAGGDLALAADIQHIVAVAKA
jgi:hypothetical protein